MFTRTDALWLKSARESLYSNVYTCGNASNGRNGNPFGNVTRAVSAPVYDPRGIVGSDEGDGTSVHLWTSKVEHPANNSSPTIRENTLRGNQAGFGGGIAVGDNSSPTIENNTISNNLAEFAGGIAVFNNSSPKLVNNTISDNQAKSFGGGILVQENSSPKVVGNEFQNNTAEEEGGAIWISSDSILILKEPDDNTYTGNNPDDIYYDN